MSNPALKLHKLLNTAYGYIEAYEVNSPIDVWSTVFNVDSNDSISLTKNLVGMMDLYNQTQKLIQQNERLNTSRNQAFINQIGVSLSSIIFEENIYKFKNTLTSEILTALEFISEIIGYTFNLNESQIDNQKVSEILQEISDLIYSITESPLPQDVQEILTRNLLLIKEALERYIHLGEGELRKALEQTIGSIALNKHIIDEHKDDVIYPRFGGIIGNISSLITVGTAIKDYLLPFFDKLPLK